MRQNSGPRQQSAEKDIKEIRRRTRRKFSAEEKIRVVLAGLRGEASIAELCRGNGLPKGSTTAGRRSAWRPASVGLRATRRARPPLTR